jgi:hypothetical protein
MLHNRKQAALAPTTERKRTRRITMKKILFVLPVLVLTLLLGGCADLFDFNLFQPLEFIPLPTQEKLESMDPADALAYLNRELTSPTFIEKMRANPGARAEVEAFLKTKTGVEPVTSKAAGDPLSLEWVRATYEWFLKVYHGNEMVNNIINSIVTFAESGGLEETFGTADDVAQFLENFFGPMVPDDVLTNSDAFEEMFEGLNRAWQNCLKIVFGDPALGIPGFDNDYRTTDDRPTEEYGGEPFNMGNFLQSALILWLVDTAVYSHTIWKDEATAIASLWNIVHGLEPAEADGDSASFKNPLDQDGVLWKILSEMGLENLFGETGG